MGSCVGAFPSSGSGAGVDGSTGYGLWERFTVSSDNWLAGDTWRMTYTDALNGNYTVGIGRVTGVEPSTALTLDGKLYFCAGSTLFYSGVLAPREFEQQNPQAGYIMLTDRASQQENVIGLAPYQGKLAVFSRDTVQIWAVDPDPFNYQQTQILANVGTVSGLSVQALGEMDVYFMSDSGIRSLRVRDASNNAILTDMGLPIDSLVRTALSALTDAQKGTICSVVDPETNRYWVSVPNVAGTDATIYVLSYFLSSQVQAWSIYRPTYDVTAGGVTTPTAFCPTKFQTLNGRIYCRAGNKIYGYGGSNGVTYDTSVVTWQTPFLDAKTPGTRKQANGIDAAFEGTWTISVSTDPSSQTFETAYAHTAATFWQGQIPFNGSGTHFALKGVSSGTGYMRFAAAICHFIAGEEG